MVCRQPRPPGSARHRQSTPRPLAALQRVTGESKLLLHAAGARVYPPPRGIVMNRFGMLGVACACLALAGPVLALLSCLPRPGIAKRRASLQWIGGELPSSRVQVTECIFRSRCPAQTEQCAIAPDWSPVAPEHSVRCWHALVDKPVAPIDRPATLLEPTDEPLLSAVGLTAFVAKLDYVLIPVFIASIALVIFALVRRRRSCPAKTPQPN